MRRFFVVDDYGYRSHTPLPTIMFLLGRLIGYVLMFGAGYVVGQVIRGLILGFAHVFGVI